MANTEMLGVERWEQKHIRELRLHIASLEKDNKRLMAMISLSCDFADQGREKGKRIAFLERELERRVKECERLRQAQDPYLAYRDLAATYNYPTRPFRFEDITTSGGTGL